MESKSTFWILQASNWRDFKREDLQSLSIINLQRYTESLLIVTQNNTKRTNYIKTQQNCERWVCGDKNETEPQTINELRKKSTRLNTIG